MKIKLDPVKVKLLKEGWGGAREGAGRPATGGDKDISDKFKSGQEEKFYSSLSSEEIKAISEYKSDDPYAPGAAIALNGALREGQELSSAQSKALEEIDKAFMKAPRLKEDTVVYRGTDNPMKITNGFVDSNAYTSTSISKEEASNFAGLTSDSEGYIYEISIPKGFVAMPTAKFNSTQNSISEEKELLLPRGTAYKVTGQNGRNIKLSVVGGARWMSKPQSNFLSKSISIFKAILPTEAQAKAGNYKKGHITFDNLNITIENPKGSIRKGVDKDGTPWMSTMQDDYGYILGVKGRDGDFLDCFVNPVKEKNFSSLPVYVIKQIKKEDGSLDEYKVMLGYPTRQEAQDAYLRNYDPTWFQLADITEMTMEEFKEAISSGYLKSIKLEKRMKMKLKKGCKETLKKACGSEKLKKSMEDLCKAGGWGGARDGAGRPATGGSGDDKDSSTSYHSDSASAAKASVNLKSGKEIYLGDPEGDHVNINGGGKELIISGSGPSGTYTTYAKKSEGVKAIQRKINTVAVTTGNNRFFKK